MSDNTMADANHDDRATDANQATSEESVRAHTESDEDETQPANHELLEAQRQRDEYHDQLQRTRAEFVNYQKRSRAQADTERMYAIVPLALDLLSVLDNFERASEAARAAGVASMVEGLDIVQKQLSSTLAKHGIEPIEALGQPFEPNLHEAITQRIDLQHAPGTVVAELGKGYRLLDRVLRPAKVAVSVQPEPRND